MKKVLTFIFACGFVFAMSSCSKDYTCVCTTSVDGVAGESVEATAEHSSKGDAEDWSGEGDIEMDFLGIITKVECEIE